MIEHIPQIGADGGRAPSGRNAGGSSLSWWIAFAGALFVLGYLVLAKPVPYRAILEFLPDGILATFKITVCAIAFALLLGLVAGLGRISSNRVFNTLASTYVEVVRGVPLLVQLFYIYYALGRFVRVPDTVAAITAMAVCYGAYMAEVFRAGIEAIDKGQTEAALSLGLGRTQTMAYVILPQAWRTILPPAGNESIALLKDTSLVSILAVADLLRRGREYASETFTYFETYTVVALIYLIITLLLSKLVSILEKKLAR